MGLDWKEFPPQNPTHSLLTAKQAGNLVFVSGQIPTQDDGLIAAGKVGLGADADVDLDTAMEAAKVCALNCVYAAGAVVNPLTLAGVVELTVYVNVAPGFTRMSDVADAASDFLITLFGQAALSARAAIGVAALPLNAPVEIRAVFEVH
jgi:enamine deaminase RidA (YjgF/YER057c/UK114 family)